MGKGRSRRQGSAWHGNQATDCGADFVGIQDQVIAEQRRPFQHVAQFANIAWPGVLPQ
ncbi:hypothetical protein D3C76_1396960 [compost metagenome]